jgi:murein DD-endopeptidase MepM/ murein hydrolase activator NlpD
MFAAAEQLIVDRRYGDAIAFCLRELEASPRCVTLRLLLARALLARHQRSDAAAQLRECLIVDPSCVPAQSALADIAEQERRAAAAAAGLPLSPSSVSSSSALPATAARVRPTPTPTPRPAPVVVSDVPMPSRAAVPRTATMLTASPSPASTSSTSSGSRRAVRPAPRSLRAVDDCRRASADESASPSAANISSGSMRAVRGSADESAPLMVPAQSRLSARISVPLSLYGNGAPAALSLTPVPLYDAESGRTIVSAQPPLMSLEASSAPQPLFAAPSPVRLSSLFSGDEAPTTVTPARKPRLSPMVTAMAMPQRLPALKPQVVRTRRRSAFAREAILTPTAPVERPLRAPRRAIPGAAWLLIGLVASIPLWNRDRATTALPPAAMVRPLPPPALPSTPPPDAAALERAQLAELMRDIWVHPLPGPARRMPIRDSRVFGAERVGDRPSECINGHCGVDIGSAFGEAVFAVHDGVVDRVQRAANEDHGGHYVRLVHRGRTIVSQYFHLAAIPPHLEVGQIVKAGDIVGWVGRSGIKHAAPHLHFTIAVQEPNGDHSRYIDPEPLIALWPLRVSAPGGDPLRLTAETPAGLPHGFEHHHHHHRDTVASAPAAVTPPPQIDEE